MLLLRYLNGVRGLDDLFLRLVLSSTHTLHVLERDGTVCPKDKEVTDVLHASR